MEAKRERSGRLSRKTEHVVARAMEAIDREQRETLAVGLEARHRVFSVDPRHIRDQKAGSAIGRYCLQGNISQAQYDAAMTFLESRAKNLRAIDAPPLPGAVDLNATRGRPVAVENVTQLARWRREHLAALKAIQSKQNETRLQGNLMGAIDVILFRDVMLEHCLGDLRTALNALVRHYGLAARVGGRELEPA
jgi:hypothetical protein